MYNTRSNKYQSGVVEVVEENSSISEMSENSGSGIESETHQPAVIENMSDTQKSAPSEQLSPELINLLTQIQANLQQNNDKLQKQINAHFQQAKDENTKLISNLQEQVSHMHNEFKKEMKEEFTEIFKTSQSELTNKIIEPETETKKNCTVLSSQIDQISDEQNKLNATFMSEITLVQSEFEGKFNTVQLQDVIFGVDFLTKNEVSSNFADKSITLGSGTKINFNNSESNACTSSIQMCEVQQDINNEFSDRVNKALIDDDSKSQLHQYIHSETLSDHLLHLEKLFNVLKKNGMVLNISKSKFFQTEIRFSGHTIDITGIG